MSLIVKEHRTTKNPEFFQLVIDTQGSKIEEMFGIGAGDRCLQLISKEKLANFPVGKIIEGAVILVNYVDEPMNEKHKMVASGAHAGKYKVTELSFVN